MSPRRIGSFLFLAFAAAIAWSGSLRAAAKLDVGAEYRLRGIQYSNPTYASEAPVATGRTIEQKYYSQRGRAYIKGKLDPGIEIATVLQAIGVSGSSVPVLNRYPNETFSPFIENFYASAREIGDWPLSLTVGRQPYVWGSGLLVSDDGMGFDGIRLEAGPFWGIRGELFTAKAREKFTGENDQDLYLAGLQTGWGIHQIQLGYVMERDNSGSSYWNLSATTPVTSERISRTFIDLQVSGRLEQGAFYRAEYAMQGGKVNLPGQEIGLSGSALTFEGGFDFIHPRYKRMVLAFVFMQGSGDDSTSKAEDERFLPTFGHKYDGLEPSGVGEFFAATPYSFYNQDKVIVSNAVSGAATVQSFPYNSLFSGLRMYGFRGSVSPWDPFTAGLEFYLFSARQTPDIRTGGLTTITETALGREMVISATYRYAKRVNFSIRWGKFFPTATLNDVGSSRLMIEAGARF